MNRLLLISCFLLTLSSITFSQGNLQFNEIKMITTQQTIPTGKVWKVLSAPYKNDIIGSAGAYNAANPGVEFVQSMLVNGDIVYVQAIRFFDGSWRNFAGPTCEFPLWLPEGTTLEAAIGVRFLSVIEFNVIP